MKDWNTYFLDIAAVVSSRSKDPRTKVGCVITSENRIISTGYNGTPPGFPDTVELWTTDAKYEYVIHAEINALLHATQPVRGGTLYTTMYPCSDCAKAICSAGISKVFYADAKYSNEISDKLFRECKIEVVHICP